jgi:hypothetical protein
MCTLLLWGRNEQPFTFGVQFHWGSLDKIAQAFQVDQVMFPFQKGSVANWISLSQVPSKQQQKIDAGIVFFFWWFIWKERNRRIFEHKECSTLQVVEQIKKQFFTYRRAHLLQ